MSALSAIPGYHDIFSYIVEHDFNNDLMRLMETNPENILAILQDNYSLSRPYATVTLEEIQEEWRKIDISGSFRGEPHFSIEYAHSKWVEFNDYIVDLISSFSEEENRELAFIDGNDYISAEETVEAPNNNSREHERDREHEEPTTVSEETPVVRPPLASEALATIQENQRNTHHYDVDFGYDNDNEFYHFDYDFLVSNTRDFEVSEH